MSETPSPSPLPGLPLTQARFASWLAGLRTLSASARAWASPGEPVRLLHSDGTQSIWRGGSRLSEATHAREPKFVAIQIPEDLVLRRSLLLPRMSQVHCAEALLLEVRSNSPFPPEDLAWGSVMRDMAGGQKHVDLAMASRRHVAEFMQARWPELAAAARQPEVWAWSGQESPVVLQGYGEIHRLQDAAVERRWNWALAGIALMLATLVAITPTIQLRQRALEAVAAFDAVQRRVAPLVRKRDELAVLNDKVRSLDLIVAERVDPIGVMQYMTQVLPDDTYLYALDLQKTKITASGHTVDASALLQKLSSDPRLKNVKAPMAVTRMPGATKEAFIIEFTMEPKPATAGPAPAAPVVVPPVAAAPAPAPAAAPAPAPAAASKQGTPAKAAGAPSPFVIGGSK